LTEERNYLNFLTFSILNLTIKSTQLGSSVGVFRFGVHVFSKYTPYNFESLIGLLFHVFHIHFVFIKVMQVQNLYHLSLWIPLFSEPISSRF
jgi:hypothetical protein